MRSALGSPGPSSGSATPRCGPPSAGSPWPSSRPSRKRGFRSGARMHRKTSRRWRSSWPPPPLATSPGKPITSTADWCRAEQRLAFTLSLRVTAARPALPYLLSRRLPFFYGWVVLACLCCAGFARQGPAVATLSIFVEPLTREFGWSRTALSGAVSLGGVLAALSSPLIGSLLDRHGSRLTLCVAVLLTGTAMMLLSLTQSLLVFWRSWFSAAATPLGCRANARLAQSQPPLGKGFRGVNRERQGVGLYRLSATADQKISLTYALQSVKA